MQLTEKEYAPYYDGYIKMVTGNIMEELRNQPANFAEFVNAIPPEKEDYAYAVDKWTVKEVVGHILDTERIMAYRALRFGRKDNTPLAGFEQNDYVFRARMEERNLASLNAEFQALRQSNLFLFESFNNEELMAMGTASGYDVSVRALLYIIAGHLNHHLKILKERYL